MWVGSAINGLGAGAIFPASLALVAAVARTMQERVRGIAIWAAFCPPVPPCRPCSAACSPGSAGGAERMPSSALVSLAARAHRVAAGPGGRAARGRRLDIWGQITFAIGLILVLFGLVQGPEDGWTAAHVLASLAIGAVMLAVFVAIELKVESPLLDLRLFRNRQFTISSIVAVVGMFAFLGACFSTSMWLGPVQHQNPLYIGLLFLLLQGPAFVLIPVIPACRSASPRAGC